MRLGSFQLSLIRQSFRVGSDHGFLSQLQTQAYSSHTLFSVRTTQILRTDSWRYLASTRASFLNTPRYASSAVAMEHNGAKRKEHPEAIHDRPSKQFRGVEDSIPATNGSETSADQTPNGYMPDAPVVVASAAGADSAEWQATIETVVSKVVSIHFCQTSAFDTDPALSSEATGFVVDEENGYIMTNRVSQHETQLYKHETDRY